MPSVSVRNFGCRANRAEAFAWADALRGRGWRLDEAWDGSDVVLVNSCTLTGRADRDVRKFIRAVGRASPATRVVVAGCYAERAPAELAALPNVAAVLPRSEKPRVAETVARIAAGMGDMYPVRVPARGDEAVAARPLTARAYLKVQDGCDNRCAFCVIPGVRGRSVSLPVGEAAAAVRSLAGRGFGEIVVAGIHLASYGRDLAPASSLHELLDGIGEAAGEARLRLSSLDPDLVDDALAGRVAGDGRICRHFHLSLQHVSEPVLRLMGRRGDPGSHARTLGTLARLAPDAALGADLIAGFPGETEADFEALRDFVASSPLTYAHVFPFSPRPGTPAASRPRIAESVVAARARELRRIAAAKDQAFRRRFVGRELEAAVIRAGRSGAEVLTTNGIEVRVPSSGAPRGARVRARIVRALPGRTEGEVAP